MKFTVQEIAKSIGAEFFGDPQIKVSSVAEPKLASELDMALAINPKFLDHLKDTSAKCALFTKGTDWTEYDLSAAIVVSRPRYAMSTISAMMDRGQYYKPGIHPSAIIDPSAQIGNNVLIGEMVVISSNVQIGDNSIIGPQCYIGSNSILGTDCYLREGVKIGSGVIIGDRFCAQPSSIIGADGFSFVTEKSSAVEEVRANLSKSTISKNENQIWHRIHSLAGVTIGNDVEIGANTCIDCGTVKPTSIGDGVKADNLAQIGHNVQIGNNTLICAQVGIAGSAVIGSNVVLGGQSGISDNIFVGDNVITGGATKVLSNIPAGRVMLGYPAMKMDAQLEVYRNLRKLPKLLKEFTKIKKAVFKSTKID
jgi:UDP-3-O-[3-hydroxymyristoyl] glucosamine N-acyltransferase